MEYIVVTATEVGKFIEDVNFLISDGWEPQGGVSLVTDHTTIGYFQAMIKR